MVMAFPLPAIAAVGFGAYLTAGFIRDIYYAMKSKQWPTTNGKVIRLFFGFAVLAFGLLALLAS